MVWGSLTAGRQLHGPMHGDPSFKPPNSLPPPKLVRGTLVTPILQKRKLALREAKQLAQGLPGLKIGTV